MSEVSSVTARSVAEEGSLEEVPVRDLVEERGESSTGGYSVLTWAFKEEVARQIGGFLRRSLDGQHRNSASSLPEYTSW